MLTRNLVYITFEKNSQHEVFFNDMLIGDVLRHIQKVVILHLLKLDVFESSAQNIDVLHLHDGLGIDFSHRYLNFLFSLNSSILFQ